MDNDIDKKIRQALSKEETEVFDKLVKEESLFDQAIQLITGRNRFLNAIAIFLTFVFLIISVVCLWQFIAAEELKELLGWSLGLALSMMAVSMFKIWAWLEMEKNTTIREIKRLELQVAHLSKQLEIER